MTDPASSPRESNLPAESAAEQELRERRAIAEVLRLGKEANLPAEAPPRFSLWELMLVTTLLAIPLALVRAFGLWGGGVTFIGCVLWTNVIYPRWYPGQTARQMLMFDLVWLLLMPVVALVCDPVLFRDQRASLDSVIGTKVLPVRGLFREEALAVYCSVGWQMMLVGVWLLARRWLPKFAGFFLGSWIIGALIAGFLGLILFPFAVVGTFLFGVGLIAFTPLFTFYGFIRRMREAIDDGVAEISEYSITVFWLFSALGFITSVVLPLQIAVAISRSWGH
ncbi:hypothetical protein NA78x_003832 [Anatilimnocola sp. NA78]|uniref:hypothetical protein n=1 Tax=Anatilimnocola sp. NA78 TaxID=3415683 RepID=UPI003CE5180E